MIPNERDMNALARIRAALGPEEALESLMLYKKELGDAVMHATRKNCLWDLFFTVEYRDAPCSSEQWIVDARKKRAEDAILRGIIE